jgi:PEP-CTERM motif
MHMRRVRLLVTLALASTILAATPAHADPIVVADQFFAGPTPTDVLELNVSLGFGWAQTFTVGIGGELAAIQVLVSKGAAMPDVTAPLLFDVRQTHGGVPADGNLDVLASVVVPPAAVSSSPAFLTVDLTAFAIPVAVGDQLAIVLKSFGPLINTHVNYEWFGDGTCPACGDPTYSRGELFFRLSDTNSWDRDAGDAGFRTFVRTEDVAATPEPATFLLVGAGLVCATRRRFRPGMR